MSIEYTIDVQLTELGFTDILHPRGTPVREAPCGSTSDDLFPPSNPVTSLPTTGKRRLLLRGQQSADAKHADTAKQTSNVEQTTVVSTSLLSETIPRCKPLNPAQSLRYEQAYKGTALVEPSGPAGNNPADPRPLVIEWDDSTKKDVGDGGAAPEDSTEVQQGVEDDSDDSEVSEMFEEEEIDEEEDDVDEEEEGMTHSLHLS